MLVPCEAGNDDIDDDDDDDDDHDDDDHDDENDDDVFLCGMGGAAQAASQGAEEAALR